MTDEQPYDQLESRVLLVLRFLLFLPIGLAIGLAVGLVASFVADGRIAAVPVGGSAVLGLLAGVVVGFVDGKNSGRFQHISQSSTSASDGNSAQANRDDDKNDWGTFSFAFPMLIDMVPGAFLASRAIMEPIRRRQFADAVSIARSEHDPAKKAWTLATIGLAQARAGDNNGAANTVGEALTSLASIAEADARAETLHQIALAQSAMGKDLDAAVTLREALNLRLKAPSGDWHESSKKVEAASGMMESILKEVQTQGRHLERVIDRLTVPQSLIERLSLSEAAMLDQLQATESMAMVFDQGTRNWASQMAEVARVMESTSAAMSRQQEVQHEVLGVLLRPGSLASATVPQLTGLAHSLQLLGEIHRETGNLQAARSYFEEAASLYRQGLEQVPRDG